MKDDLILLHGWGGSANSLKELSTYLSKTFNVHVLEMPGHGDTDQMNEPWNMAKFSEWLTDYLNKNNIENFHLLGHSFGGKIILDITSNKLLNPKSCILINANGVKPKNSLKKKTFKFLSTLSKPLQNLPLFNNFRKLFYKYIIREADYVRTAENVRESFKLFNEEHYDDKLENIDVETHIIWGKEDRVTPLWMGQILHNQIKNSTFDVIEGTHGIPLKKAEEVANIILNYYK